MAKKQSPFKVFSATRPNVLPHFEGTKEEVYNWLSSNMYELDDFRVYITETEKYQHARVFLEKNRPFAPKFYRMDPETEDLLPSGRYLANGMRVLLESPSLRAKIDEDMNDWMEDRALERNRWCTVGDLEVTDDDVRFVGVYDDGSKRMRNHTLDVAWLVKIDSISDSANVVTGRYQDVFDAVKVGFAQYGDLKDAYREYDFPGDKVYRLIEETTKKILDLT